MVVICEFIKDVWNHKKLLGLTFLAWKIFTRIFFFVEKWKT